jgi:8-oxo-dGTP pyrophosphatase MutT (NUDIX family)
VLPLWPVPPVIALIGVVLALTKQKGSDLWLCAAIFAAALLYYFLFVRPRRGKYWTVPGAIADPGETPPAQ